MHCIPPDVERTEVRDGLDSIKFVNHRAPARTVFLQTHHERQPALGKCTRLVDQLGIEVRRFSKGDSRV